MFKSENSYFFVVFLIRHILWYDTNTIWIIKIQNNTDYKMYLNSKHKQNIKYKTYLNPKHEHNTFNIYITCETKQLTHLKLIRGTLYE